MYNPFSLEGKTILITGGAKGIGRKIAEDFASLGYNVCINYNTSKDEASDLKDKLASFGYSVMILKADISKVNEVNKMIDEKQYKNIKYGIKLCNKNIGFNGKFYTFPYFMTFFLKRFLNEKNDK